MPRWSDHSNNIKIINNYNSTTMTRFMNWVTSRCLVLRLSKTRHRRCSTKLSNPMEKNSQTEKLCVNSPRKLRPIRSNSAGNTGSKDTTENRRQRFADRQHQGDLPLGYLCPQHTNSIAAIPEVSGVRVSLQCIIIDGGIPVDGKVDEKSSREASQLHYFRTMCGRQECRYFILSNFGSFKALSHFA